MSTSAVAWAGVTIDSAAPDRLAAFWSALLGVPSRPAGPGREGWYRLGPTVAGGPVLNFQPVGEAKAGKVRIHLDLWCDDLDAAVRRVGELGGRAPRGYEAVPGRGTIAVVADPEGHEFCLISAERSTPSSPPTDGDREP